MSERTIATYQCGLPLIHPIILLIHEGVLVVRNGSCEGEDIVVSVFDLLPD